MGAESKKGVPTLSNTTNIHIHTFTHPFVHTFFFVTQVPALIFCFHVTMHGEAKERYPKKLIVVVMNYIHYLSMHSTLYTLILRQIKNETFSLRKEAIIITYQSQSEFVREIVP